MSIKVHQQQQFKVPQGTKVYLVNPESLRHSNNVIIGQNLQIDKINNNNNFQQQESATVKVFSAPKVNQERKHRKRKIESVDLSNEDEEDIVYSKIFSKETTTRTGRISKSRHLTTTFGVKSSESGQTTEPTNGVKVKKREPASVFRCAICQKVYIGFKKLNLHFRKFPDHYSSKEAAATGSSDSVNNNNSDDSKTVPSALQLKKYNNTLTEMSRSSKFLHCETQTEGCIISNSAKVDVQVQVPTPTTATADSEVSKILSPPPLRELNTINKPDNNNYSFVSSLLLNPNDEPEHTLCLQTTTTTSNGLSHRPPHHHHHRSPTNSNDFCEQNFSPYRNTSSNQIELGESNGMMGGSIFYDRHSPVGSTNNHSIHSRSAEQQQHSGSQNHHRQNNNSPLSSSSISPLTTKNHHSGIANNEIPHHLAPSIHQKRAWDIIEEKMTHQGINEILLELNDVAEKLSKIARDKIIPIREEEEERLRANNNVPIVLVDSPFLSHLLDLPFGTYMYKEDAGVRLGLLPPPVPAELSLTGGEEVDVGKFLTPDIDLINLPHLTNIDFAAICSNN